MRKINKIAMLNIVTLIVFVYMIAVLMVLPSLSKIVVRAQQTEQALVEIGGE